MVAIQTDHPAKKCHCHAYGCQKSGNMISLCDVMKPGANGGGRPRGERFKEIAGDLKAMAEGPGMVSSAAPSVPASKSNEHGSIKRFDERAIAVETSWNAASTT